MCRGRLRHFREDRRIERFMTVEIDARVICAVQETSEDQHHASGKQQAARRAAVREQPILYMRWRMGPKMPHQTQEKSESGKNYQQSKKVRKDAGPANRLQRAIRETDVVNQKDAYWQQHPSGEEYPRKASFCSFLKCDPWLEDR